MSDQDADVEFQTRTQAFLDWLPAHNIRLSKKIKLADLRERHAGRGVVAVKRIKEDEELFSIPRSSILTAESSTIPQDIVSGISGNWLQLVTALIYEYAQGQESIWKPYIDLLPERFDTLMFWTEQELEWLEGCAVLEKIGKAKADESFSTQVIPVIRKHAELFKDVAELIDEGLLALCHRMASTIMAYAFDIEKHETDKDSNAEEDDWEEDNEDDEDMPIGMIPMADMLNAEGDSNNAKLYYEEDRVVMRSIKPIRAGQEIFNDYGAIPTADLARRYGYVRTNCLKYDVVEIGLELVKKVASEMFKLSQHDVERRIEYLSAEMVLDAFDVYGPQSEGGQFQIELLAVLRCMAMDQETFDKYRSKGKLPSEKPLSKDDPESVLRALKEILLLRSFFYSTKAFPGFDQDVDTHKHRQRMAYTITTGEKEVLHEGRETIATLLETVTGKDQTMPAMTAGEGREMFKRMRLEASAKYSLQIPLSP